MYRMRTLLLRTLFVGLLCASSLAPAFAFAQTANQSYQDIIDGLLKQRADDAQNKTELQKSTIGSYLDVKVNPPIPGPNTPVQINIESYLTDLYKANISWYLNGQLVSRGIGRTSFTFQNGPSGQATLVALSFVTNTGEAVNKSFSFNPVGVTIMWEADTYTPPFYKGKALPSPEARMRIIAVPEITGTGNPLNAGSLVYVWKKNDNTDTNASGYGKNVYSFTGPKPLTQSKITLSVSTLDDSAQSEMRIYLPQVRPFILFYEKDPLLGVKYNKPLEDSINLNKREVSISAEPYFFSNEKGDAPSFRYTWSVNAKNVQNYGRNITLRNDTGAKGSSLVSLYMRGITQTFQSAKKDLKINFNESSASGRPIF